MWYHCLNIILQSNHDIICDILYDVEYHISSNVAPQIPLITCDVICYITIMWYHLEPLWLHMWNQEAHNMCHHIHFILLGLDHAELWTKIQAAVWLLLYWILIAVRIVSLPGEAAQLPGGAALHQSKQGLARLRPTESAVTVVERQRDHVLLGCDSYRCV
jgi:hypothetical protein